MSLTHEQVRMYLLEKRLDMLAGETRLQVESHLQLCPGCRKYLAEISDFDQKVQQSLSRRWPEQTYTKAALTHKLEKIRGQMGRQGVWRMLNTVGRTAAGAVLLLGIIAGLVWIVGGTISNFPGSQSSPAEPTITTTTSCMSIENYQVLNGDSVESIAAMFGIPEQQIRALNGISGEFEPGKMIRLMGCPMRYGTPFPGNLYQIQAGDTCQSIAAAHSIRVEDLAAVNGLGNGGSLNPGQTLLLPLTNQIPAVRVLKLYYFSGDSCGADCQAARTYLDGLMGRMRGLDVVEYNVEALLTNRDLYNSMAAQAKTQADALPAIFVGERFWIGFDPSFEAEIEIALAECQANGCLDPFERAGGYPGVGTTPAPTGAAGIGCGEIVDMLVGEGETVSSIADQMGVPAELIRQVNGIFGDQLTPGSHIRVVGCPIRYGTPYPVQMHVVQAGDTCLSIATQYQVSTDNLREINHLSGACEIWVGQQLAIPWFTEGKPTEVALASPTGASMRYSLEDAERRVRDYIFSNQPDMNPEALFPLSDITPDEAWQRMGVQVFKVTDGVKMSETYLIYANEVVELGTGFGGMGVDHMQVTDLDRDSFPEFVFTYSFGSGIHQSSVGIVVINSGRPEVFLAEEIHFQGDFSLEKTSDQDVLLSGTANGEQQEQFLGRVVFVDGKLMLVPENQ
jgi:LysM repeat protein